MGRWLVPLLKVPDTPPEPPLGTHGVLRVERAAPGYYKYLLLKWGMLAGFQLLRTQGKRKAIKVGDQKLTATAWFADCLFFPEDAKLYNVFLVQDSDVLIAVGLGSVAKRKRDVYSYADLEKGQIDR